MKRYICGVAIIGILSGCGSLFDFGTRPEELQIATQKLDGTMVGAHYRMALSAKGGSPPYRWSLQGTNSELDWITIDPVSGELSGVPWAPLSLSASITVQLRDSRSKTITKTMSLGTCADCSLTTANQCGDGGCLCGETPACGGVESCCLGECVDFSSDASNCGQCGRQCPGGDSCFQSNCVADLEWANWSVPLDIPNDGYDAFGSETVIDKVTKLMWQKVTPSSTYSWEEAKSYCAKLDIGGQTGWRLPTRIELMSIVDFSKTSPAISDSFPNTFPLVYWTSSVSAIDSSRVWVVVFDSGSTSTNGTETTYHVRCVR